MKYISTILFLLVASNIWSQKNVGIGTVNPNARLHLHQDNVLTDPASRLLLTNSSTGAETGQGISLHALLTDGYLTNQSAGNLYLGTNNINRVSILNSGRIGFNTSTILGSSDFTIRSLNSSSYGGMYIESPDAANGRPFYGYATGGAAEAWHYFDASTQSWRVNLNGDRMTLLNSGKLGIGTTAPNQPLSVNGKLEVADDASPPTEGSIRWSGTDFDGYDGNTYKSFTYYEDRQSILGYEEYYEADFCSDPDTILIFNNGFPFETSTCAVIYDTGGSDSGYGNNENISYYLPSPLYGSEEEYDYLKIIVESVDLEPTKDSLFIEVGNLVYSYTGSITTPDTIIYKDSGIIISFQSDGSNPQPYQGFKINVQFSELAPLEDNQLLGYYFNPGNRSLAAGLNFGDTWKNELGQNSIAFGFNSTALGDNAIAIGRSNEANSDYSIAIGENAIADSWNAISLGKQAEVFGIESISIGYFARVNGEESVAVGHNSHANCDECVAIGVNSQNFTDNSVLIGNSSTVNIGGYQNWSNLSDGRFKTNIQENIPGLAFIKDLRPVTYTFDIQKLNNHFGLENETSAIDEISTNQIRSGFIAQEVETLAQDIGYNFSGVASPKNEENHYSLRYAEFVVPLVKAVQELSEENDNLKAQLLQLEQKFQSLEAAVSALQNK